MTLTVLGGSSARAALQRNFEDLEEEVSSPSSIRLMSVPRLFLRSKLVSPCLGQKRLLSTDRHRALQWFSGLHCKSKMLDSCNVVMLP